MADTRREPAPRSKRAGRGAGPLAERRAAKPSLVPGIAAIAGLSSLVFAQPVYDLLRRSPEFFAIRELYLGDLLALVALVAVVPTLALSAPLAAARFLRPPWTRAAVATVIGLLVGLIALQAARELPPPASLATALAACAGAAWAYLRFQGARSFAALLSAAAVLVPALLVLDGQVRRSASGPGQAAPSAFPDTGARAPIVLVVFDEWSLISILDRDGSIDRERLPNLARLADQATWYPNATAASDKTHLAIPSMLTGRKAALSSLPTLAEHPVNLFTVLAPSHDVFAAEAITSLCPPEINLRGARRPRFGERFSLLLSDLSVVWLSLTLPAGWTERLPDVTHAWSRFGQGRQAQRFAGHGGTAHRGRVRRHPRHSQKAAAFLSFVDSIGAPGQRPVLYYLHTVLPHKPWEHLPSGRTYDRLRNNRVHGLQQDQMWTSEPWTVLHHRKRYLLQVQFMDVLIGELIDKLQALDMFDRSVIAIAADHGVAFEPGQSRRRPDGEDTSRRQPLDIAAVPLIIKAPFQQQAGIDETVTSLAGLAPRIVALAGGDPSAFPGLQDAGVHSLTGPHMEHVELPVDREPWRRRRLAEQAALLGEANDPMAIGAVPGLHGRELSELPRHDGDIGIQLIAPEQWDDVDRDGPWLPAIVHGILTGPESLLERSVAVALNGVVAATVRPHQDLGKVRIAAMLPERLLLPGHNQLEVFVVSNRNGVATLEQINRPPSYFYELARTSQGEEELRRLPQSGLDTDVETFPVVRDDGGVFGFLENGHRSNGGFGGFALDLADPGGIEEVVVFLNGNQVWTGRTTYERPRLADRYGQDHLHSGFSLRVRPWATPDVEILETIRRQGFEAIAVSRRGVASRLRIGYTPLGEEARTEVLPVSDGRRLPVLKHGGRFDGSVDLVTRRGTWTHIEGWAGDLEEGEPARRIVVYRDGEAITDMNANSERPDIAAHHDDPRLLRSGFRGGVPGAPEPASFADRHRVFALMHAGFAVELPVR